MGWGEQDPTETVPVLGPRLGFPSSGVRSYRATACTTAMHQRTNPSSLGRLFSQLGRPLAPKGWVDTVAPSLGLPGPSAVQVEMARVTATEHAHTEVTQPSP